MSSGGTTDLIRRFIERSPQHVDDDFAAAPTGDEAETDRRDNPGEGDRIERHRPAAPGKNFNP
jgi:hypothetical protein